MVIVIFIIVIFVTMSAIMAFVIKEDMREAREKGHTVLTVRESLRRNK
jgi:uncharacterized membrane protein YobD (UPF0266 family)